MLLFTCCLWMYCHEHLANEKCSALQVLPLKIINFQEVNQVEHILRNCWYGSFLVAFVYMFTYFCFCLKNFNLLTFNSK